MSAFQSVSVIIPVINETDSLKKTIETIIQLCDPDIKEYLLMISPEKTSAASLSVCESFKGRLGERFKILPQRLPGFGGALRTGLDAVQGSHAIILFADGEANPEHVPELIKESKAAPDAVINISRWLPGSGFEGYPFWKYGLNYFYQLIFSALYGVFMKDLTYGYRLLPIDIMKQIKWKETSGAFVPEVLFRCMRSKVAIKEIPGIWRARVEGKSQKTLCEYLRFYWIPFKYRFYSS